MNRFLRGMLTAALAMPLMLTVPGVSAATPQLSTDKTVYEEGEEILVTAYGSGKDWVGIYARGETPGSPASIYWYYVAEDAEPGDPVSIRKTRSNNRVEYASLPGGAYTVFLLLNDGYTVADSVDITVMPAAEKRLRVSSEPVYEGNPPRVTAFGFGGELLGIWHADDDPKQTDPIWSSVLSAEDNGNEIVLKTGTLEPGDYTVGLYPAEGFSSDAIASGSFTVTKTEVPDPVASITYRADRASEGLAGGVVTITPAKTGAAAEDILLWWGRNGKPLDGYARLTRAHASADPMEITLPTYLTIPEGADGILACASNRFGISDYAFAPLPDDAKPYRTENVKLRFQVSSDWHVTDDPNHDHNRHLGMMLDDTAAICPDCAAIIAVGDIADHGSESEYKRVKEIIGERNSVPPVHYVIGNHDVSMGKGYKKQLEIFNEFSGNDEAYYDLWIEGYHFIFLALGSEGAPLPIPEKELKWLDSVLDEDASPEKPIFVFCHESIMDTVAGSTQEEGWWGISNGDKVAAIFSEYPQTVFFNGHSHWEMDSKNEMFAGDGKRTFAAFNTSSVGYLWTGYNVVPGEYLYGSEGLFVEVSDNALTVRGRDFVNGLWSASAQFAVPGAWENVKTAAPEESAPPAPAQEADDALEPDAGQTAAGGCSSAMGAAAVIPIVSAAALSLRRKKKDDPEST
ncbi:MAG: metallophosphoesterase [Clostridia bacterium]|nr:metallophosphoesterase [Clostridia bacterium]